MEPAGRLSLLLVSRCVVEVPDASDPRAGQGGWGDRPLNVTCSAGAGAAGHASCAVHIHHKDVNSRAGNGRFSALQKTM